MPVVDYSKTVIYKIQHESKDELLYVGSTTHFGNRKTQHKHNCYNTNNKIYNNKLYTTIRDNGGWDAFNMVIVKEFPCENRRQAECEEDKVIRQMRSDLNMKRAFLSPEEKRKNDNERHREYYMINKDTKIKEYIELNKDKIAEKGKIYREQHKDYFKEYNKDFYQQNREKILEQRKENNKYNIDRRREYNKEYEERNKEILKGKRKIYREKNKDKIKEYNKEYSENNKIKIKEQRRERYKEKIKCECDCMIRKSDLAKHLKTLKHQTFINQQTDQ